MENPRAELPEREPYVLSEDRKAVEAHARSRQVLNDRERYALRTELLPTPFLGNPRASVVLLNLNPGFDERDRIDYADPAFREAALRNLTHGVEGHAFFPIDPRFRETSSYDWWMGKLRWLIEDAGLGAVSNGVFCVQAYPYHSREFAESVAVPSQHYTEALLVERIEAGAIVIGMRRRRYWEKAVPQIASYASAHWLRNPRNPTLSPGNFDGFGEVVSALRQDHGR